MKIYKYFKAKVAEFKRRFITNLNTKQNKSDVDRWKQKKWLFDDWNERTKIMAQWIKPNSTVLEFGAAKMALKQFLPKGVVYTPSDIVDRGEGTLVCDLNREMPDFKPQDVIFFSGVLEYIYDVPKLIENLSSKTNRFIISYGTFDVFNSEKHRKINGWVNTFTNDEILSIFKKNNFELIETETWRKQTIYVFDKLKS
ncbi:methyltransferase domain-containing protein [Hwangdonia seohaensis]|uniref:Methyltransferase domain-containing protein n=1 Tax=Hwangdonia seohaensis TaxID=1240727 RepID=A0ABW3RDP3_9FLAO|nr:methyltransferase domain-containing protein [Hwangdonia seohaensis]